MLSFLAPVLVSVLAAIVIPDPLQALLVAAVAFVVTWLLTQVTLIWPFLGAYLGPYRDQVVAGVSAYVIAWLTAQLNLIPVQYTDLVNAILNVLVIAAALWIVPFITFKYFQRKGLKSFRLPK